MKVEAVALSDFIHGDITAREGRVCRHRGGDLLEHGMATELERAGLVRIRTTPKDAAPMQPDPAAKTAAGKASDDGRGQPSSVSRAAPVSAPVTSVSLKPGDKKTRKSAA